MLDPLVPLRGFNVKIRIARYSASCSVLGPGTRGVLWVQGCKRFCKGCVAPETWDLQAGTEVSIDFLTDFFCRNPQIEGLTFSGGEPMLQAEGLVKLVDVCKTRRPELSMMAFTGFTLEELLADADPGRLALLSRLDVLIDGPYRESEHENLLWRGSRNQHVWFLSPRYESSWKSRLGESGVHLELEADAESLHIMGIPPRNFREKWEELVQELGLRKLPESIKHTT